MKRVALLSLFMTFGAGAAISKKPQDDLSKYRSQVMELGARLSTLEKEIGSKNNLYLSSIQQIKQFESDITLYRDKLKEVQSQVAEAQVENKKILQSYLIESENEANADWQRRVHLSLLQQAQNKLKTKQVELASYQEKVSGFDQKLAELKGNEEELGQVIKDLEGRKKSTMEVYLAKVEDKKRLEKTVVQKDIKTRLAVVRKELSPVAIVQQKPDRFFANPVDDYSTFTPSAKGVTFKYKSVQPVKAVGKGKVVFAGDLSNYGQVLLIDHGNDLRTVLLGRMNIRVKKNDTVADGDILGYTINDSKDDQNLYFEVRKKNTAQNTILWLDSRGVSKI
jgi:septal ring factor EnvC (AmiA/AmiB activator)